MSNENLTLTEAELREMAREPVGGIEPFELHEKIKRLIDQRFALSNSEYALGYCRAITSVLSIIHTMTEKLPYREPLSAPPKVKS